MLVNTAFIEFIQSRCFLLVRVIAFVIDSLKINLHAIFDIDDSEFFRQKCWYFLIVGLL
jgi:hypothetical protein